MTQYTLEYKFNKFTKNERLSHGVDFSYISLYI